MSELEHPLTQDMQALRAALKDIKLCGSIEIQSVERANTFDGLIVNLVLRAPGSAPSQGEDARMPT